MTLISCGGESGNVAGVTLLPQVATTTSSSAASLPHMPSYVIGSLPRDARPIEVNFENKVHLIGYRFDPATPAPGSKVRVAFFWRCDETLGHGWQLFTHLLDDVTDKTDDLDYAGTPNSLRGQDGRQRFGPDRWEAGNMYIDELEFTLPLGSGMTLFVGIWKGDTRLNIVAGPNDGDNRTIIKLPMRP